jgi:hypothetical protein
LSDSPSTSSVIGRVMAHTIEEGTPPRLFHICNKSL